MTKNLCTKRYLAFSLIGFVLMLPVAANAGVGDIIQLLVTITNTLKGEIGQVLGGIQKVKAAQQNLQQQIVWPLNAINQAKGSVLRVRAQYTGLAGQIHSLEVSSANLVNPKQFESLLRSRQTGGIGQLQPAFLNVYGAVPSAKDATPMDRNLMDVDDAMATGSLKTAVISDQASEQMLSVADSLERQSATTAPGAATFVTTQAQVANLQSQAFLQRMLAAELRQEATRLAHDNAVLKRGAEANRNLRDHMQQILSRP
jgi:hypothetical protein